MTSCIRNLLSQHRSCQSMPTHHFLEFGQLMRKRHSSNLYQHFHNAIRIRHHGEYKRGSMYVSRNFISIYINYFINFPSFDRFPCHRTRRRTSSQWTSEELRRRDPWRLVHLPPSVRERGNVNWAVSNRCLTGISKTRRSSFRFKQLSISSFRVCLTLFFSWMQYLQRRWPNRGTSGFSEAILRGHRCNETLQTCKADEDGVWSWWKVFLLFSSVCVIYLSYIQLTSYFGTNLMAQTDMICGDKPQTEETRVAGTRMTATQYV